VIQYDRLGKGLNPFLPSPITNKKEGSMIIKRAEEMSKAFSEFLNDSVKITQETWKHKIDSKAKTETKLSYFVAGHCHIQSFNNLDEVQNFIDDYIKTHVRNPILFRKF
jgi:hypothetical protein